MKHFLFLCCLFISSLCVAQNVSGDTVTVNLDGYTIECDEEFGVVFAYSEKDCYVFNGTQEELLLIMHASFPHPSEEKPYITRSLYQTGNTVSTKFEIHFENYEHWRTIDLGIFFREKGKTYQIKIEPL